MIDHVLKHRLHLAVMLSLAAVSATSATSGAKFTPLMQVESIFQPTYLSDDGDFISTDGRPKDDGTTGYHFWSRQDGVLEVLNKLEALVPDPYIENWSVKNGNGHILVNGDGQKSFGLWTYDTDDFVSVAVDDGRNLQVTRATANSANGDTIVGHAFLGGQSGAFRWTELGGVEFLEPTLQGSGWIPWDISSDGSFVIGDTGAEGVSQAVRWTPDGGVESLGVLRESLPYSEARRASDDGRVVGGYAFSADQVSGEAFRWSLDTGMVGLGIDAVTFDLSEDGSVQVGYAKENGRRSNAFIWTEDDGALDVGAGWFWDVTPDGTAAVGYAGSLPEGFVSLVWDETGGSRPLQQVLSDEYDLAESLTGWELKAAYGISRDGLTIAGTGIAPDGNIHAWIVDLDYSISSIIRGDLDHDRMLAAADINLLSSAAAANSILPRYDFNGDSMVDEADVQYWLHDLFGTWMGDVNLDGEFGSADLVNVFQAGKYELDVEALWSEGDWNADGRFSTRDLVAAFQDGGYERGPRAAVQAVPEPSSVVLLALAMSAFVMIPRDRGDSTRLRSRR